MNQTVVEWLEDNIERDMDYLEILFLIKHAKSMEAKQRQEDTNNGYSQGYDDGIQDKEPMQPEIIDLEKPSYQDKMRDKITKAKSRLK
jgi:hypothetical protein